MKKLKFKLNKKVTFIGLGFLLLIVIIGLVLGIVRKNNSTSPMGLTKEYFDKYVKEDKSVTSKIVYDFSDKLNSYQEKRYKEIIKKQYRNLHYSIVDSYVGEGDAHITVEITVVDLKSAYEKSSSYIQAHEDKFLNNEGSLDDEKVIDYKLEQLEKTKESVSYSLLFDFYRNDVNHWEMMKVSDADVSKINGTF